MNLLFNVRVYFFLIALFCIEDPYPVWPIDQCCSYQISTTHLDAQWIPFFLSSAQLINNYFIFLRCVLFIAFFVTFVHPVRHTKRSIALKCAMRENDVNEKKNAIEYSVRVETEETDWRGACGCNGQCNACRWIESEPANEQKKNNNRLRFKLK